MNNSPRQQPSPPPAPGRPTGRVMLVLAWLIVLALLSRFFSGVLDYRENPNQQLQGSLVDGIAEVVLKGNRNGHYVAHGSINGQRIVFMVDTGATNVAIPEALAKQLGLRRGPAHRVMTANGSARAYATRIDLLTIGDIVLHNVSASINPGMQGEGILLGMSALAELELVHRDGQLLMRQQQ